MLQRILNFVIGQYYHTNKESTKKIELDTKHV
jgi:hypothetical protein